MLKVCIIGCGMIANSAHIPAYKRFEADFTVEAVSDVNGDSARETAQRHNIDKWFDDAERMLCECRPDLVSVCVPNCFHKEYVMLALKYGANVLCEKPLAFTKRDVCEMFACAKERGRTLMACQSMRYTPDRLAAKKYIEECGEDSFYYTELSRVRRRGIPYWGAFHIGRISGGGAFADIGIHMIDAAIWLTRNTEVLSVCGVALKNHVDELGDLSKSGALTGHVDSMRKFDPDEMDVEDFGAGCVRFKNGAVMNFKVAWAANQPEEASLKLVGRKIGINIPECKVFSGADGVEAIEGISLKYGETFAGHVYLVENMRDVLICGDEPAVKPEETVACAEITEAFYRSARLGREVFVDELQSNRPF